MGCNTTLLSELVHVLDNQLANPDIALQRLDEYYAKHLLVDAGDIKQVMKFAKKLRLHITREECPALLAFIQRQRMVALNIDIVEQAINEFYGEDRFIEP